ncbi:response regulator [Cupriavidus ulmosensis]
MAASLSVRIRASWPTGCSRRAYAKSMSPCRTGAVATSRHTAASESPCMPGCPNGADSGPRPAGSDRVTLVLHRDAGGATMASQNLAPRSKATILLVDDEQLQLHACARLLEGSGFHVIVASDGSEALNLARSTRPAIVVTDLNMPGLDGAGLCSAIKADESLKRGPANCLHGFRLVRTGGPLRRGITQARRSRHVASIDRVAAPRMMMMAFESSERRYVLFRLGTAP